MRDAVGGAEAILRRAFRDGVGSGIPRAPDVPALLHRVRTLAEVVAVDLFLPGCPPPADLIHLALSELLAGRLPRLEGLLRFG
jgi:NAD-reducing hydrogenase small subunit